MASRYSKLPLDLLSIEYSEFDRMRAAADANIIEQERATIRNIVLPFFLENQSQINLGYQAFCESLGVSRPVSKESGTSKARRAADAIARAEMIKSKDLKRRSV